MKYSQEEGCVACAFGDGTAILDTRSNLYFTVDEVGSTIWELMSEPVDMSNIVDTVVKEYDVSETQCRPDIDSFLEQLKQRELVKITQ